jgi:hypothetical protein
MRKDNEKLINKNGKGLAKEVEHTMPAATPTMKNAI